MTELAPLALYTLGALIFSVLTAFYWRVRRERRRPVLSAFTLVCAAAFLDGLLSQLVYIPGAAGARELAAGLIPPLMLHLALDGQWQPRGRRVLLAVAYSAALVIVGLRITDTIPLYSGPAAVLGASALTAAAALALARGERTPGRNPTIVVLLLMTACAAASLAGWGALVGQAPDYLVLAFFCVTLYYRERFAFFDVVVKLGAFAAVGMAGLALCELAFPAGEWPRWMYAAAPLAFWLSGAALYPRLSRAIDRRWLRRPFSAADAERRFLRDIQTASAEQELAARAAASLSAIFQTAAEVRFESAGQAPDDALTVDVDRGRIVLPPRPDGAPFLSDDFRLLQTLGSALSVVLDNIRFREREQQLRLLATRAELKALRAQINPHFLFNSLSVIAGLIHSEPRLADETIEHLAQVFRYTLRRSDAEWTPLGEEVEFVTAYLRIEQARFGARLETEIAVDPAAASIPVPAMCIQPLVENAIRHGLSATPGPGRVALRASIAAGELRIEVEDSGPGFPPGFELQSANGHGLRNIADRLRGYYGEAARLSWSGGAGARVTIALPLPAARAGSVCA